MLQRNFLSFHSRRVNSSTRRTYLIITFRLTQKEIAFTQWIKSGTFLCDIHIVIFKSRHRSSLNIYIKTLNTLWTTVKTAIESYLYLSCCWMYFLGIDQTGNIKSSSDYCLRNSHETQRKPAQLIVDKISEGESITPRVERGKNSSDVWQVKCSSSVWACFLRWMLLLVCDIFDPVWQARLLVVSVFPNYLFVNA